MQLPRATRLVIGFTDESDARRVMEVLPKRFGKYGLTIHPDKTRLAAFARPQEQNGRAERGSGNRPGTFDFLGFTHSWGISRRGNAVVKKRTAASRIRRFAKAIGEWCRRHRHRPIQEQHVTLSQKLRGHDAYYGVTGNCSSLNRMRAIVARIWRKWLGPGAAGRAARMGEPVGPAVENAAAGSAGRPLGVPARVKRWPDEPDAVIPHVRICGSPGWATAQGDPAMDAFGLVRRRACRGLRPPDSRCRLVAISVTRSYWGWPRPGASPAAGGPRRAARGRPPSLPSPRPSPARADEGGPPTTRPGTPQ